MEVNGPSFVKVDVFKRANGDPFIVVSLYSDAKPARVSKQELALGRYSSQDEFLRAAEAAGGALAEHQNELYGDDHEPTACAAAAVELVKSIFNGD